MSGKWCAVCLSAVATVVSCMSGLAEERLPGKFSPDDVRPKFVLQQEADLSTNSIAFSPDSKTVVTAGVLGKSEKLKVRLWDTQTGQLVRELKYDIPPDDSWGSPGVPRNPSADPLSISEIDSPLVTYSPDGKTIAVSSGTVSLWNAETGNLLGPLRWWQIGGLIYDEHVTSIIFSPDSKTLVVGIDSGFNTIRMFDAQTGKQLRELPVASHRNFRGGSPRPVVFSPDGKMIATGGISVRLWDAP